MRKIQLSLILIFVFSVVFSKQIDVKRAVKIAKNIFYERVNIDMLKDYDKINLLLVHTETKETNNLYYIFNINNTEGFVIISADDVVKPIIGYSFEKSYGIDNISPEQDSYMEQFRKQIHKAIKTNIKQSREIKALWQKYEFAQKTVNEIQSIQPLLITTWGQSAPYNDMCPVNNDGQQAIVGCVAVSFAQLMKYYNYPEQGTGSHTYTPSGYSTQSVNFGNTEYEFENIPYQGNGENEYLARLMYHCGVAVDMMYGTDGSGSYTQLIADGLESYFKYSTDCEYISQNDYSDANWVSILKNQIDNGWPMSYSGYSDEGGHAWNCDGYQAEQFHMNWGWNGYQNGFYEIGNLNPGGSVYSYNSAIINVYPNANYPEGCNSTKYITGKQGAFNDGSGNQNYENNTDCSYHLVSECNSYLELNFRRWSLADGDHLYIYDGANTMAPLIADYDNSITSLPNSIQASTNDGLFINFITDGNNTAEGWYVEYNSEKCNYSNTLTATTGSFEDGSKICEYENNTYCKWYLEPEGIFGGINLEFTNFDMGDANDYVKIYKGHSSSSTDLIAELHTGDNPTTYLINDTKATVKFFTNSNGSVGEGWTINYDIVNNIDINNNIESFIKIYPNPFNTDANIKFNSLQNDIVNISIINILGKNIGEINKTYTKGMQNVKISEISEDIKQGVYFVKFHSLGIDETIKIIVSK